MFAITGCPVPPATVVPPALTVFPTALNFGPEGLQENFLITNTGGGSLTWTVTADETWAVVTTPSGDTTTETDRVFISADRTGLVPGTYNAILTVSSNGGTSTIPIALEVPGTPLIQVNPQTLTILGEATQTDFTITNLGTGTLTWSILSVDPDSLDFVEVPSFLTVTPEEGTTAPGANSQATVAVSRDDVPEGVSGVTLAVTSDSGTVLVELVFAASANLPAVIGVDPSTLDFGESVNQLVLSIFNDGPAGSLLDFTLSTDNPALISFSPASGQSFSTGNEFERDNIEIVVSIDRRQLQDTEDGGTITISAPAAEPNSAEIEVLVQRANLTLEGAFNSARPPSILRFQFLIRDEFGEAVDTTNSGIMQQLQTAFTIEENEELLDLDETNFFVDTAANTRSNMVVLLDYTGSMFNADPGNGAAITQMVSSTRTFLQDLPTSFSVALMEYHDRQQSSRLIRNFDDDREVLDDALESFAVPVGENGASQVYDALLEAIDRLADEDRSLLPFNTADFRSVVFITDGRDTSSTATPATVITAAAENRVRLYPIGFGDELNESPLIEMAEGTGGHYYPAHTLVDLANLLGQGGTTSGLIAQDLERQVILTYISLLGTGGSYQIRLEYDGNEGSFQRNASFALGDPRAGQISLTTPGGIADGRAEIFVRTEYVPRAVSQMRFRVISDLPYTVDLAPEGLLDDGNWTLIDEGMQDASLDGVYTAITSDASALPFGAFGRLFRVTFENVVPDDFEMGFRMDNTIYINPPFTKFFQYPDAITVFENESGIAEIFPLFEDSGFDPDDPFAFNRDEDGCADFNDPFPDDDELPLVGDDCL
jgi:hypothetical protein